MVQYLRLVGLALLLLVVLGRVANAASFNCDKAITEAEIAICADPELIALDGLMGAWWLSAEQPGSMLNIQNRWLTERNQCLSSVVCLKSKYEERFLELGYEVLRMLDRHLDDVVHFLRKEVNYAYQTSAFLYMLDGANLQVAVIEVPNIPEDLDTCHRENVEAALSFNSKAFEDIIGIVVSEELSHPFGDAAQELTTFTKWAGHGDQSHKVKYMLINKEFIPYKVYLDTCLDGKIEYVPIWTYQR